MPAERVSEPASPDAVVLLSLAVARPPGIIEVPPDAKMLAKRVSSSVPPESVVLLPVLGILGRVDGFDDDEAQSECDEGSEVLVRFLATERNSLEALELADEVFDAGAGAIERLREERWSVPGG